MSYIISYAGKQMRSMKITAKDRIDGEKEVLNTIRNSLERKKKLIEKETGAIFNGEIQECDYIHAEYLGKDGELEIHNYQLKIYYYFILEVKSKSAYAALDKAEEILKKYHIISDFKKEEAYIERKVIEYIPREKITSMGSGADIIAKARKSKA